MTEMTRRAVLGAGASGAVLMATSTPAEARPPAGCVDVHAHAIPAFYRRALKASGITKASGLSLPRWTPKRAIRFMDDHGIAVQVLSLPDPGVTFLKDPAKRVALARRANNYLLKRRGTQRRGRRGRFGAFATLPLAGTADVPDAIAEARRALGLGLDGVSLFSNYGPTYLGDPGFAPLLTYLSSVNATVFVQANSLGTRPATLFPAVVLEGPFNTARAIVQMSYLQAFTAYPGITWLFGDGGGVLPYLAYRSSLLELYPAIAQNLGLTDLDDTNFDYGRLYYDTAWASSPASCASLREVAGSSHVLFGTDYPFSEHATPGRGPAQPELASSFRRTELNAVLRKNARRVLPHLPRPS